MLFLHQARGARRALKKKTFFEKIKKFMHRPADTDKGTETLSELNQEGLAAFEKCVGLLRGLGHELGRSSQM
jgi:hypothetical protein